MSKNEIQNESMKLEEDIKKDYSSRISELNKTINEKEFEINSLQSKIIEFSENIDLLKKQNEKLQQEVNYIGKELNINDDYQIFSKNILQIQPTQRFIVLAESNYFNNSESFINLTNNYSSINNNNKELSLIKESINDFENVSNYISNNFSSKLTPFKMQPYKQFDHSKLNINFKEFETNFINEELLNEIKKNNNTIIDSINNFTIEQIDNKSKIEQEKEIKGKQYHSSMFFKTCKKTMNKNEYRNLLDIIKLSNSKKITKEETYLKITNLLDKNYPELSNEFKLLFV